MLLPSLIVCSLLTLLTGVNLLLRKHYYREGNNLIDEIDSLLPQTQCAQCGYAGCRPYANSIASGESIDLCLPGGPATQQKLSALMQRIPTTNLPQQQEAIAFINEEKCIGCALCLPACPVDAIAGSKNFIHTIIKSECTGCELCVEACPVDCIEMQNLPVPAPTTSYRKEPLATNQIACINCKQCDGACPANISPHLMHKLILQKDYVTIENHGLSICIECGICDLACPSGIPLTEQFQFAKNQIAQTQSDTEHKTNLSIRFERHQNRLTKNEEKEKQKRSKRLGTKRSWL